MSGRKQFAIPRWRLVILSSALLCACFAVGIRVAMLQVVPEYERGYQFLQQQGDARTIRELVVPASRGMVFDRNGKPLAVSTPVISVWADPKQVDLNEQQLADLGALLEMAPSHLRDRLQSEDGKRFVYLRRGMEPDIEKSLQPYTSNGVYTMQEYRRYYPAAEVAAQVVGVTNIDDQGLEGIELGFDKILAGKPGRQRVVRDLQGRVVESAQILEPAEPGTDVWLTLDSRLQYLAYTELKKAVAQHQAGAGSVVILDVKSGDVLAMANQPSFNPNSRRNLTADAARNRAVTDTFEPGSTVKPFTMLAALESGKFSSDTVIDTSPGRMRVGQKLIYDPVNYGRLSLPQVLAKSSQVGTTKVALELDPENIRDTFVRAGLGDLPGTGLPGETVGTLPQRYEWRPIEHASLAYGYGLSVTALQLAQAYATIGNDGARVAPRIFLQSAQAPARQVADAKQVEQVREMMQAVVETGTGKRAAVAGYKVAGKTGTVHMVGSSGYEEHHYSSIFAGLAPAGNPELAIVIVINDPKSDDYSGGLVAAPVFSQISGESLRLLGIAPNPHKNLIAAGGVQP